MFPKLKDYFIPTDENDYRPGVFRVLSVFTILVLIVGLFGGAVYLQRAIISGEGYLAAVISSVLVDLTNGDRAENGLHTLSLSPTLAKAAQMKAVDMAEKGYFAHTSPEGLTPWHWFKEAEYGFLYAGENLAVYFSDSADVERAWMNSSSHRANILNSHFTEIGIATAEGEYQGRSTVFVVQMFGTPAKYSVPVAVAPQEETENMESEETPAVDAPVAVLGESTPSPKASEGEARVVELESLDIVAEDESFIAVKNTATVTPTTSKEPVLEGYSTLIDRFMSSPRTSLGYLYMAILIIVVVGLGFMIGIELKEQRPLNVAYAVLLVLAITVLVVILEEYFFGTLRIL